MAIRLLHSGVVASTLAILVMGIVGCSAIQPLDVDPPKPELLAAIMVPPPGIPEELLSQPMVDLLGMSKGMLWFTDYYFDGVGSTQGRLERLYSLLRDSSEFQVKYDAEATTTAAETFANRRGNCLAFSAMFVALAREVGLTAHFQEVAVPPVWDSVTDDTLIQYRHVNVRVDLPRGEEGIIDFRVDRYSQSYPQKVIDDKTALAHYYSNISMERLVKGDLNGAYMAARQGIQAEAKRGFIWNNMGIILRRMGHVQLAEASYRQALQLNPHDWSALNNLAVLFDQRGDLVAAEELRDKASEYKMDNPYYLYALAQQAYRNGEFESALDRLNQAVVQNAKEHRFYFLRGLSLWELGETDEAISNVRKAIKMGKQDSAATTGFVADYEQQLSTWMNQNG